MGAWSFEHTLPFASLPLGFDLKPRKTSFCTLPAVLTGFGKKWDVRFSYAPSFRISVDFFLRSNHQVIQTVVC